MLGDDGIYDIIRRRAPANRGYSTFSYGNGRKGTRPSLAERIVRAGKSSDPGNHLNTLRGQLRTNEDNPTLNQAIRILQGQARYSSSNRQDQSSRNEAFRPTPHRAYYPYNF